MGQHNVLGGADIWIFDHQDLALFLGDDPRRNRCRKRNVGEVVFKASD